jgi:hypothetical protein
MDSHLRRRPALIPDDAELDDKLRAEIEACTGQSPVYLPDYKNKQISDTGACQCCKCCGSCGNNMKLADRDVSPDSKNINSVSEIVGGSDGGKKDASRSTDVDESKDKASKVNNA